MQRAALARRRPFCLAEQCCSLLVIPALVAGLQLTSRDALVEGWIPGSHAESMPPAWPRDDNWTSAEGAEVVRDAVFGLARRERRGCQRTRSASGTGKCARAGKARGDENRGAGRSWPSNCLVGCSHRRPTQAQAPTNRLPPIASLPGAHWHFRASDRGSWGYAYGPG
jgi:hypothetical protein